MKKFSERNGYTEPKKQIDPDEITQDIRVVFWNEIHDRMWRTDNNFPFLKKVTYIPLKKTYLNYFRQPIDEFSDEKTEGFIKKFIRNDGKFFELYDFIEFFIKHIRDSEEYGSSSISEIIQNYNNILEEEQSRWRLGDDGMFIPTMSAHEKASINQAKESPTCGYHIKKALNLLKSDRENSIKESILAVESIVKKILNSKKGTLGSLISELPDLHLAFKKGISSLYGFTSDDNNNIRHGSGGEKLTVDFETALYMLVSCSAFCNFLSSKYKDKLTQKNDEQKEKT